jgi:hypothetical protein
MNIRTIKVKIIGSEWRKKFFFLNHIRNFVWSLSKKKKKSFNSIMESLDRIKCVFKMSDWKPITCYCDHNSSHSKDFNKNKNFNIRNREKSCFRSTGFLLIKTMFILKIIVCLLANNCRALSSHSSSGNLFISLLINYFKFLNQFK